LNRNRNGVALRVGHGDKSTPALKTVILRGPDELFSGSKRRKENKKI